MQKVRLNELSGSVRAFLAPADRGEVIVVEDDAGRAAYSVVPIIRPTSERQQLAWDDVLQLQKKVGESMLRQGVTEDDVDRLLHDDL